jgi:hypothetical protein
MSPKPKNRAGLDAEAVARMMAAQAEEETVPDAIEEASPPVVPAAPPEPKLLGTQPEFDPGKVDGRTLRKTGREPFATRIKPETHEALRRIAYTRRITIAEALESAVAAYDGG